MKSMTEVRIAVWAGEMGGLSSVELTLSRLGYGVERVDSFRRLWELMQGDLDLVIVSCQSAPDVIRWIKSVTVAGSAPPPVLTMATAMDVEKYLRAMALGAYDCVAIPIQEMELRRLINRAMEERHAEPLLLPA